MAERSDRAVEVGTLPAPPRSDPNYLEAAFYNEYNLISLGGFFLLGCMVSGFWYMGAALELAYLALVPGDPRFQRYVRSEQMATRGKVPDDPAKLAARLTRRGAKRYEELTGIVKSMEAYTADVDPSSLMAFDTQVSKLDYLVNSFLKMLFSAEQLEGYLGQVDRGSIRRDIERLERQIEAEKNERIAKVKRRNLEILGARIKRLDRAIDELEYMNANLNAAEDTVRLIRDRVISSGTLGGALDDLDGLVTDLREGEQHLDSMDAMLEREKRAMAAEDLGAEAGDFRLPELEESDGATPTRGQVREG